MKDTRILMGMPVTVEIVDSEAKQDDLDQIFTYFAHIDAKFSPFKSNSEISEINRGMKNIRKASREMQEVIKLCQKTKQDTFGYFDIFHNGKLNPSGLVKGWAIYNAAKLITKMGFKNYFVDAGGDIQVGGKNQEGKNWRIGLQNPFKVTEIIKAIEVRNEGVATSGTYLRGQHIYNPFHPKSPSLDIISLTVIGPNVYEADRFATAAFAMGKAGIAFINNLSGFAGYMIDRRGRATFTSGFTDYILKT